MFVFIQIPSKGEASKRQSSLRKEQKVQVARIAKEAQRPRMEIVAYTPTTAFLLLPFSLSAALTALHLKSLVPNHNVNTNVTFLSSYIVSTWCTKGSKVNDTKRSRKVPALNGSLEKTHQVSVAGHGRTWLEYPSHLNGCTEREVKESALLQFMRSATCCYKQRSQATQKH